MKRSELEMEKYRSTWEERWRREKEQEQKRIKEAEQSAKSIARYLHQEHGVETVYLIGSLRDSSRFSARSDIDLVVKGLDPSTYVSVLAGCRDRLPDGMELDVIPFEDAAPEIRREIERSGKRLSGKS